MRAHLRLLPVFLFLSVFAGNFVHASTPEVAVADTILGPAPFSRWQPSIASNGTELFGVWADSRVAPSRVIGTRFHENGEVLDGTGIAISGNAFLPALDPRVVWSGSFWLVFWRASVPELQQYGLIAARIDRDGHPIGVPYIVARGVNGEGHYAASDGAITVVAYTDSEGNAAHAAILDREGNLLRDVPLPSAYVSLGHLSVATDGSGFAVAWHTYAASVPTIEAVRLDASGNLRDATARMLAIGSDPFLESDGTNFVLLSRRIIDTNQFHWQTTAVDASLTSGTPHDLPNGNLLFSPTILHRHGQYVVIAERNSDLEPRYDIAAIPLSPDATPSTPISLGDLQLNSVAPHLGATLTSTGKLAVIWNEIPPSGEWKILTQARLFSTLDRTSSSAPLLLSRSANPHYDQSVAYGDGMLAVAWRGLDGIYATRVTLDGRSLDGAGIRVRNGGWSHASIAFDGTNFVIAYLATEGLTLRFVSPSAGLLEKTVVIPSSDGDLAPPAFAVTPQALYIAWGDGFRILATRIPHATHIAEMPVVVSPDDAVSDARIAWNGTSLLVSWVRYEEIIGSPSFVYPSGLFAARVSPSLTLLDPAPIPVADNGSDAYYEPWLASNGKDWLFVWQQNLGSIEAKRMLADGRLEEQTTVAATGSLPRVTFDGTRYAVAWKESDDRSTLRIAFLTSEGAIQRSGVATVAPTDSALYGMSLAPTPNGIATTYTRVSREHGGVERTFLRIMKNSTKKRAVN